MLRMDRTVGLKPHNPREKYVLHQRRAAEILEEDSKDDSIPTPVFHVEAGSKYEKRVKARVKQQNKKRKKNQYKKWNGKSRDKRIVRKLRKYGQIGKYQLYL